MVINMDWLLYKMVSVFYGMIMKRVKVIISHIGDAEMPYVFKDVDQLLADFLEDVRRWQNEHSGA